MTRTGTPPPATPAAVFTVDEPDALKYRNVSPPIAVAEINALGALTVPLPAGATLATIERRVKAAAVNALPRRNVDARIETDNGAGTVYVSSAGQWKRIALFGPAPERAA